jgi:hypothetical protein
MARSSNHYQHAHSQGVVVVNADVRAADFDENRILRAQRQITKLQSPRFLTRPS